MERRRPRGAGPREDPLRRHLVALLDRELDLQGQGVEDGVVGLAQGLGADAGRVVLRHEDARGRVQLQHQVGGGDVKGVLVGCQHRGGGLLVGIHAGRDGRCASGAGPSAAGLGGEIRAWSRDGRETEAGECVRRGKGHMKMRDARGESRQEVGDIL